MGNGIRDEWEITMTIKTFDGDPKMWGWSHLIDDEVVVTKSDFKRRVLEDAEVLDDEKKSFEVYTFTCDPDECDALIEFVARDGFGFPSGEVSMKCPCGRQMIYIKREAIKK